MNKKMYNFIRILLCSLGLMTVFGLSAPSKSSKITQEQVSKVINAAPLGAFLNPWELGDQHELLQLEFEDAELSSFIRYIEERFEIKFITDDDIKPMPKGGKGVMSAKITFKSHKPLTKKEAWSVFLKFLDLWNLAVIPGPAQNIYRITTTDPASPLSASKAPLPTFVGTNPALLPDNDSYIRYVALIRDADLNVIGPVLDAMKSASSPKLIDIPEVRGILITDKAANIRAMMDVVQELDTVTLPETMSIIRLKRADAVKVAKLYEDLTKAEGQETLASRVLGGRKAQTTKYFAPGTRVIPEPRTNTLILLGSEDAVRKIEEFILENIDTQIEKPYTPLHVYTLKFTQAESVAKVLTDAVKFQVESDAAKAGGVRDGDKFFKPVTIIPEKSGNRLIITADYEDYLKIHDILEKIDVEQPQVAMKVLIIDINLEDGLEFGMQIRNKKPGVDGLLGQNVNFQTSGLAGKASVVENPTGSGATRLLGDLVTLATGGVVGSTYVTLGSDCYGVWGMFRVLQSYTNANIVSNPFIITTNNYPAQISLGETRRVPNAQTIGAAGTPTTSFANMDANLKVFITPQISYEGYINLKIEVTDDQFTTPASDDISSGNRIQRRVNTSVILANNEVLALGGLVREIIRETETKVPILGDIPLIGWLFKNKSKSNSRVSQIVLIAPEIIPPNDNTITNIETAGILKDAGSNIKALHTVARDMDPVHRWFFGDTADEGQDMINKYISKERRYLIPNQEQIEGKKKRLSDYL